MSDNHRGLREQGMEKFFFRAPAKDFKKISGHPIAYWATVRLPVTVEGFREEARSALQRTRSWYTIRRRSAQRRRLSQPVDRLRKPHAFPVLRQLQFLCYWFISKSMSIILKQTDRYF